MNYYSVWSFDSSQRQWERVNESLREQHAKNMRESTRFIIPPQPKEQSLFTQTGAWPEVEHKTRFTAQRQASKQREKMSMWTRIKRWLL